MPSRGFVFLQRKQLTSPGLWFHPEPRYIRAILNELPVTHYWLLRLGSCFPPPLQRCRKALRSLRPSSRPICLSRHPPLHLLDSSGVRACTDRPRPLGADCVLTYNSPAAATPSPCVGQEKKVTVSSWPEATRTSAAVLLGGCGCLSVG